MPLSTKKYIPVILSILFLFLIGNSLSHHSAWAQSLLPAGTGIQKMYRAGAGLPLGKIQSISGGVFIIHRGKEDAYLARVGLPLFRGDTIITGDSASLSCRLKDGSVVKLAGNSKLLINLSTHDTQRKSSISSLYLASGKAYFQIAKLADYEPREFKVETGPIIAGGRKADFAIFIQDETIEIVAFKDSILEVMSLNDPELKIFLSEFQRVEIQGYDLPSTVEVIPEHEAKQILGEFRLYPKSPLGSVGFITTGQNGNIGDEDLQEDEAGWGELPEEYP
jgi:hypothetical protein